MAKGIDAYKVVTKDRMSVCTFVEPFIYNFSSKNREKIRSILLKHKVTKIYKKGSRLKARKGYGPIMCFRNESSAKAWANNIVWGDYKIIKVRGWSVESFLPLELSKEFWTDPLKGIKDKEGDTNISNSICFRRIKVLT